MSKRVRVAGLPPGGMVRVSARNASDKPSDEGCISLALGLQQRDDFRLGARLGFFGCRLGAERSEVEFRQIGDALSVNGVRELRGNGDMRQGLPDGARLGRGLESVLAFWNVFGDLNRVLAHRAKRRAQLFPAIVTHRSGSPC